MASAARKPTTIAPATAPSVMSTPLIRSCWKYGALNADVKLSSVGSCGNNVG